MVPASGCLSDEEMVGVKEETEKNLDKNDAKLLTHLLSSFWSDVRHKSRQRTLDAYGQWLTLCISMRPTGTMTKPEDLMSSCKRIL